MHKKKPVRRARITQEKKNFTLCSLLAAPGFLKRSAMSNLLGKCQHQQIPRGKEELKHKSLFSAWNKTAATCSTFAAEMFNSWLSVQQTQIQVPKDTLGLNSARSHQGLGVRVSEAFPSG